MPEGLFFLLFLVLLFGVRSRQLWRSVLRTRRLLRSWHEAAGANGLQVVEASNWIPRFWARKGPLTVAIDGMAAASNHLRIDVRIPGPPDSCAVSIRREPLLRRGREIEIGDPRFDSTFFLEGPARSVLARLDAEMRHLLTCANTEGRLSVSAGLLRLEELPDEEVPRVLPLLLHIGQRLSQPVDIAQRLAENARRDPEAGVRRQNLLLLIHERPEAPETHETLRMALADSSPEVRLQAARALGAEARGILLDLAESLVDDAVSAEAVSALEGELSFERTKAILDQAQDRRLPRTAHACLEALGQKGASPGQVSMGGSDAGQLSLAPDGGGHLSLLPAESGLFELPAGEPGQPPPREREGPGGRPG